MLGLDLDQTTQAIVALIILAGMFTLFLRETYPVEVVAMGGAALMVVIGILPVKAATEVLANSAPWTIAMMFLIMGGLVRTGAVEMLIGMAEAHAGNRPRTLVRLAAAPGGTRVFGRHRPRIPAA